MEIIFNENLSKPKFGKFAMGGGFTAEASDCKVVCCILDSVDDSSRTEGARGASPGSDPTMTLKV